MMLRELATAWVRKHCPSPDVQQDICQHLERALQRNATCSFTIGPDLIKSGKPFLVYCFSGELFAFEITKQQAGRLNVNDNMLVCAEGPPQQDHLLSSFQVVWLENVAIDNAASLDRLRPITGTLRYGTNKLLLDPWRSESFANRPAEGGSASFTIYFSCRRLVTYSRIIGELRKLASRRSPDRQCAISSRKKV